MPGETEVLQREEDDLRATETCYVRGVGFVKMTGNPDEIAEMRRSYEEHI